MINFCTKANLYNCNLDVFLCKQRKGYPSENLTKKKKKHLYKKNCVESKENLIEAFD